MTGALGGVAVGYGLRRARQAAEKPPSYAGSRMLRGQGAQLYLTRHQTEPLARGMEHIERATHRGVALGAEYAGRRGPASVRLGYRLAERREARAQGSQPGDYLARHNLVNGKGGRFQRRGR